MSIKSIPALSKTSKSYDAYIVLLNNTKSGNEAPKMVEVRKAVVNRDDQKVYYEILPGEVLCRLPLFELDDDDNWVSTGKPCLHIADTTNNLRKHMRTIMHSYDKFGVREGEDGGVKKEQIDQAVIFFKAFIAAHRQAVKQEAALLTEINSEDPTATIPPISPRTTAALNAERDRVQVASVEQLENSSSTQPGRLTSSRASRKKITAATPDLWDIPLYTGGLKKGEINYTQVKQDLATKNRAFPCSACLKSSVAPKRGQKKSTRCDITNHLCLNYSHYVQDNAPVTPSKNDNLITIPSDDDGDESETSMATSLLPGSKETAASTSGRKRKNSNDEEEAEDDDATATSTAASKATSRTTKTKKTKKTKNKRQTGTSAMQTRGSKQPQPPSEEPIPNPSAPENFDDGFLEGGVSGSL